MSESIKVPDVFGVETEYSCILIFPDDLTYEIECGCHSAERRVALYKGPKTSGAKEVDGLDMIRALDSLGLITTNDGMLSNGGRFYLDPSGPEYATPETTTAEEAVHRTFDGDSIILGIFSQLVEAGVIQGFQVNRRIIDHNRNSRGVHLNTTTSLTAQEHPEQDIVECLATLNVVKGAMFGSGGLLQDQKGNTHFHHSPRLTITSDTSAHYQDYQLRPLVRYPYKTEGEKLSRIETVTSDALNFGWPLRASLVITNSLVRLLELRRDIVDIPYLIDHKRAAKAVGRHGYDTKIKVDYGYSEGDALERPLTVLRYICETLLNADDALGILNNEAIQVLPEIIDVTDKMSVDPISVAPQVESMARLLAMQRKMEADSDLTFNSEKMCRFDFAWDKIGGGIAEKLRQRNTTGWQGFREKFSPHARSRRLITPPSDTRAKIRGDLILEYDGKISVDWSGFYDNYLPPITIDK